MEDKIVKGALDGSIEKWEKIDKKDGADQSGGNCPLCNMYTDREACSMCPVKKKTGKQGCLDTPYEDWTIHQRKYHKDENDKIIPWSGYVALCPECHAIARREVNFLKSLREE